MASTIMVDINTANIAIELADAGTDFADLMNEVALQREDAGHLLAEHELTFFRQRLDDGGRALVRQLAAAIDAEGE